MTDFDTIVVGAGVVGLAIARALAIAGRDVTVVERHRAIGSETSSRNSEVIHAGIYYPKGSLKARLCVAGKEQLYRYCAERGVPHRRIGKLIVATTEAQVATLDEIRAKAAANGVDLRPLSRAETLALEPALAVTAGLFSPSTGIIDSHGLMQALAADLQSHGGSVVLATNVAGVERRDDGGFDLLLGAEERVSCRTLVLSAGLGASKLAGNLASARYRPPDTFLARGNYFSLSGPAPFRHLVYPVPEPGGLGVHLTLDLAGRARFGPDVEWISTVDYHVDPTRSEKFYDAIRRYWPGLKDGALQPDYSGIRPKLSQAGEPAADFRIEGPAEHGIAGLVALFGIESPGLTSCLALGDMVRGMLSNA